MSVPLISVVMSVYDGERFLREAIGSVLEQSLESLELIVVDDGSADATSEILAEIEDPRVRIMRRPHAGLAAALNAGIARARAPLIGRMDADDVADPERFERQYAFLQDRPEVGLLGTGVRLTDFSGCDVGTWVPPVTDRDIRRKMMRANQFAHPSVVFRRSLFEAVGGYDERMARAQDYDLWLRMLARTEGANLPDPLLLRRLGREQFGTPAETSQIRWAVRARMAALRRGEFPLVAAADLLPSLVAAALPGPVRQLLRRITPGTSGVATRVERDGREED